MLVVVVGFPSVPAAALPVPAQALHLQSATISAAAQAPGAMVIDYPTGFSTSVAARFKKAGVGIVIRYVGTTKWKSLTRKEADALRTAGVDIATVYETNATWMLAGRAAGVSAAKKARTAMITCGGPRTPFVYFACDTDTQQYAAVNACLRGAASVLGADHVGIYGNYSVCASALKSGYATKAWQTEAWSGGKLLPKAALYQTAKPFNGNLGIDYDSNHLRADDVGQWGYSPPGGSTWTTQTTPTTATLRSVAVRDANTVWAVGDRGAVVHTSDGGSTWAAVSTPATATLRSVALRDTNAGWAVGEAGTIIHTMDGGSTWTTQSAPATGTLMSVAFSNSNTGWAVGEAGTIIHTIDGGSTWTTQSAPTTASLTAVGFRDANTGWAVGDAGTVVRTTDGGSTWTVASTPATLALASLAFRDASSGFAVGVAGTVLGTSNGGATWSAVSTPATATLRSVVFTDANTGWAVGEAGTVIHTTDGGSSWATASSPTTATLFSAAFTDANTGWAVGDSGTVIHAVRAGPPDFFGRVAGVVTDAKTGKAVSGANVQIGSRPAVPTATDGSFAVARVAPGSYTLTLTSPRYITYAIKGIAVTAGATATCGMQPTPRAATSLKKPSVAPGAPIHTAPLSLTTRLSPAAAASSTVSAIFLSHYEQKTVTTKVKGKTKKVKVWYWRQRLRSTMTADVSGRLVIQTMLAAGSWRAYVRCAGSGRYLPSTSATLSFNVH